MKMARVFTKIALLAVMFGMIVTTGSVLYAQREEGPPPPPWYGFMSNAKKITFEGTVVALTFPVATVKTDDGKYYIVRLGPWGYWRYKGFSLKKGARVKVDGYCNDDLVFPKTIETAAGTIVLRDNSGYPLWRGMMGPRHRHGYHGWKGRYYCPPCWDDGTR
ncbi:MAG: hypothetical protein JRI45_11190 [Deltaproteobacteria bacterium]|nr:hypothetical protein [Deltaproteobacteria bacterium]MBW2069542.1 hypothetical protein [Deltaproteobacteria bacterium]